MEREFICPYCGQKNTVVIDYEDEEVTTDCEVCCNPIDLRLIAKSDSLETFKELE